jgi:hypothetical protein
MLLLVDLDLEIRIQIKLFKDMERCKVAADNQTINKSAPV